MILKFLFYVGVPVLKRDGQALTQREAKQMLLFGGKVETDYDVVPAVNAKGDVIRTEKGDPVHNKNMYLQKPEGGHQT